MQVRTLSALAEAIDGMRVEPTKLDRSILDAANIWAFDIETKPMLGHAYQAYKTNLSAKWVLEPGDIICWSAASYADPRKVYYMDVRGGYERMLQGLWEVLDRASFMVTYNGGDPQTNGGFDYPRTKGYFARLGWMLPRPAKSIDLFKTVRGMGWDFKSLYWAAEMMGLERNKIDNGGAGRWFDCIVRDDEQAWKDMRRYSVGDVRVTLDLYDALRPYIRSHPAVGFAAHDDETRCPRCGSNQVEAAGTVQATVVRYKQLRCLNPGCRGLFRSTFESRVTYNRSIG